MDETTIEYLKGRRFAPQGFEWERAATYWRTLKSDPDAKFDREVKLDARDIRPHVTWGTSPEMVVPVDERVPDPDKEKDGMRREGMERALQYMGLKPRTPITDISIDKVFIGSCTNSRIEDLRDAAAVVKGRRIAPNIRAALVVPGSGLVKRRPRSEGLDRIFRDAGFQWREPGCSMCLGMNPDRLDPGERCASTSNRNFEGRQGPGGRTHLVSPAMAAAAAIAGTFRRHQQMNKFTVLNGVVVPLDRANVDTDQIIPKQYLASIKRTGYEVGLFAEWRKDPQFVLNRPQYKDATILLARKNFGCGSSREHAPWALMDYGFRCVIAPSFADIFFTNSFKNGFLPVVLSEAEVDRLFHDCAAFPGFRLVVDLEQPDRRDREQ